MLWTRASRQRPRPGRFVCYLVALVTLGSVKASGVPNTTDPSYEEKRAALFLQRATFGPRPGDFASILEIGTEAWLEEQLHPERIDDRQLQRQLARFSDLELSTAELMKKYPRPSRSEREALQKQREAMEQRRAEAQAAGERPELRGRERQMAMSSMNRPGRILLMMSEAKLVRAVSSERQLQEVMTDFWFNHFNIYARKNLPTLHHLPSYERDAIRPHALGKFHDLLLATAQHPAMLRYLDNWISTKEGFDPRAAFRKENQQRGEPL